MITIGICDDEKWMADKIKHMICGFFHSKNLEISILQFSSGEELLQTDCAIDILFLDIQMTHIDGMTAAKILRNRNFKGVLIFTTILKELVFESFEVQAFDYLVKPIDKDPFEKTMNRLLSSLRTSKEANLMIQKGTELHMISFEEIVYCEIIDRKVYLYLKSGNIIDYYDKMELLEKRLDNRFFKCHRSYLINLQYLRSYKNGVAYLCGNYEIPVSRLRRKEFTGIILQYMTNWR